MVGYSKSFLRVVFLIFLAFSASSCAILEKQRQQAQVLLNGKTFTVENRSENEIYLSLLEWSGKSSAYERIGDLGIGGEKKVTINSYFFTKRGSFSYGGRRRGDRELGRASSLISYQVTFTVSGNQVTAMPRLRRYCRGRNNESDMMGSLTGFNCQRIDNSFKGISFRILTFFDNFYNRVERVINGKGNY